MSIFDKRPEGYDPETNWYFVSNDRESQIVQGAKNAEMRYQGGRWTSSSGWYVTRESLIVGADIQPEPCKKCSQIWSAKYSKECRNPMLEHGICFTCNFWRERIAIKSNPKSAIISGNAFMAEPSDGRNPRWNGFGGRVSTIRWKDGRTVTTNNLWTQGPIPARFLEELPDDAEFLPATP